MSTLNIGAKIMQYRIIEVLGAGGFGVTYLVEDEMLKKLFAVKEYFPEQFAARKGASVRAQASKTNDFQWGMQRFLEEAQSLARFQHPNIVGVSQIFEANNTAYIVLEYQKGRSLKEWLSEFKEGPGQDDLDKIVVPILNALELIHRNNMLHRDLAPDNIYKNLWPAGERAVELKIDPDNNLRVSVGFQTAWRSPKRHEPRA